MKKLNVLVVCSMAHIRSMFLAQMLHELGMDTRARGSDDDADKPVTSEDLDWADRLVVVDDILLYAICDKFPERKGFPVATTMEITNADWVENQLDLREKIEGLIEEFDAYIWSVEAYLE